MKTPRTTITLAGLAIALLSTSALAAQTLTLSLDPAAAGPGKFAAEEIRREATAKGIALRDDDKATRLAITVEKDAPHSRPIAILIPLIRDKSNSKERNGVFGF